MCVPDMIRSPGPAFYIYIRSRVDSMNRLLLLLLLHNSLMLILVLFGLDWECMLLREAERNKNEKKEQGAEHSCFLICLQLILQPQD